jgi:glycosyltransferase involved in cell wall biosynthesis
VILKRLFKGSSVASANTIALSFPLVLKEEAREEGPYSIWIKSHRWNPKNEAWSRNQVETFLYRPSIGILVQCNNPKEEFLRESLSTIFNQIYPFSELQIVDRGSANGEIRKMLEEVEMDPRVKVSFQKGRERDTEAIAKIMKKAQSEWLLLMGAEDVLEPNALYNMVAALQNTVDIDFVYADSDMIDDQGLRFDPQFKPIWAVGAHYPLGYYQHPILLHERLVKKLKGYEIVSKLMEEGSLLDEASNHSRFVIQAPGLLYHARLRGLKNEIPPAPVNNVLMNENYTIESDKPVIDTLIRNRAEPNTALKILWAVDSFDLEDGPIYLLNLARFLLKNTGHIFTILSTQEGPLSKLYQDIGRIVFSNNEFQEVKRLTAEEKFDVALLSSLKDRQLPEAFLKLPVPYAWQIASKKTNTANLQRDFQIPATILFPSRSIADSIRKFDQRGVSRLLTTGVEFPEIKLFRQRNSPFELRNKYNVAKGAAVISIFGPTIESKAQKLFVQSAIELAKRNLEKDIQFFIVGERQGSYTDEIKKLIEASSQSEKFHLVRETADPADRYPYFWISDICVSCAVEEIFPLTILEAMAFKKAVLGTNTSAASEVIEDWGNGFLIPPENLQELTDKLDELVNKMDLTEDFGRRSHEIAMDHYHIKKTAAKLEQFLRESIVY